MRDRAWLAAAIVVLSLVGYPLATLAGGTPRFPSRDDCVVEATEASPDVQVVYGRFDAPAPAEELLAELDRVGLVGANVELDGCGRWKVAYEAVDSYDQARALAQQVRDAGFQAAVELEG